VDKKKSKTVVIFLRLPEAEAVAIKQAAATDSRSVSNWCRIQLAKAVKK